MKYQGHVSDPKDLVTKEYADQKYSATNTPPYPVRSVNGKTGDITVAAGMSYEPAIETDYVYECEAGYVGPFLLHRFSDDPKGNVVALKPNVEFCGYFDGDGGYGYYSFEEYNHNWSCMCYGDGKLVAIAKNERVSVKMERQAWNTTMGTLPFTHEWGAICYGNGKFVAIPTTRTTWVTQGAYSTDGVNWSAFNLPYTGSGELPTTIAFGGGKFVISTALYKGYVSTNLTSWTQFNMPRNWQKIIYDGKQFVGFCDRDYVGFSTDGSTWTERSQDAGSAGYYNGGQIGYANGYFVLPFHITQWGAYKFGFSSNGTYWKDEWVKLKSYTGAAPTDYAAYLNEVSGILHITSSQNNKYCRILLKSFIQNGEQVAKLMPLSIKLADNTTLSKEFVVAL